MKTDTEFLEMAKALLDLADVCQQAEDVFPGMINYESVGHRFLTIIKQFKEEKKNEI